MRIYLIRHGQSVWQVKPSQDWDSELSHVGRKQSVHLGDWLGNQPVDDSTAIEIACVVSSPSKRATATAAHVARAFALPMTTESRLLEATFHVSEHLPFSNSPFDAPLQDAPSIEYAAFKLQAQEALAWLVAEAGSIRGPICAITHGALIETLLRVALATDSASFELCNTGINLLQWRGGRWEIVYINRWEHLPPGLRTF